MEAEREKEAPGLKEGMALAHWREALREYWQWKEDAHLNEKRLQQFRKRIAGGNELGRQEAERIGRIQALWAEKKLEPLKVSCRVRIVQVQEGEGEVETVVSVSERHVHRDRQRRLRLEEEERCHRIKLKEGKSRWHVVEDVPLAEAGAWEADLFPSAADVPALSDQACRDVRALFWRSPRTQYRRDLAVRYAESWWNGYHPQFRSFAADCTNFVSQCLLAGGAPMTHVGQRDKGWWYQGSGGAADTWSYSWAVAHSLRWYLATSKTGLRAVEKHSASQLEPGDVICYDFDGDGRWQHNAVVAGFDPQGEPLVNAHTAPVRHKHWSYRHSYAWTERIQYKFFHIVDQF